MPADLSQLGNILPMLGALAGGGLHSPGVLAGLGDAIHEQNQREYQQRSDARKAFADQLERIGMDSDNWTESARTAAMHARLQVLSNPKAGPKDFEKHWQSVLDASQRPDATQTMASAGHAAAADRFGAQAAAGAQSPGVGATGFGRLGVLGTQHAATQEQQAADTPPSQVSGPFTPGEKAIRQYSSMLPFLQMWGNGGSSGGGTNSGAGGNSLIPVPSFGPKGPAMRFQVDRTTPVMLQVDGQWMPGWADQAGRSFTRDDNGEQVNPTSFVRRGDNLHWITEQSPDGRVTQRPVSTAEAASNGTTFRKFVAPHVRGVTDEAGNLYNVVTDGTTGELLGKYPIGKRFAADIDLQAKRLGIQGKELANIRSQIYTQGYAVLSNGTTFVPNGMPENAAGPIAPIVGSHGFPTNLQLGKASAAVDLYNTAQEMREMAPRLIEHFGMLRGNVEDWANAHGQALDSDPAGRELIGRWIMLQRSLGGFAANAHRFYNADFAQKIEEAAGSFGQNFEFDMGKLAGLSQIAQQIQSTGTRALLPTNQQSSAPIIRRPANATASTANVQTTHAQFAVGQRVRTRTGKTIIIKALSPDGSKVTDYEEVP